MISTHLDFVYLAVRRWSCSSRKWDPWRPDRFRLKPVLQRISILSLAICLLPSALLRAQSTGSPGLSSNRTTSGAPAANLGARTSLGSAVSRPSAGPSQGTTSSVSRQGSANSGGAAQSGLTPTYGNAAARYRAAAAAAAAAGSATAGQNGFSGANSLPTHFVYGSAVQPSAGQTNAGIAAQSQPTMFGSPARSLSRSSSGGISLGQNNGQGGIPGVATGSPSPSIATALTVDIDPTEGPPSEAGLAIAEHLLRLPALHFLTPVRVDFDGRTAILRATVASQHDRDLAERVVRLEATVDDVVNLLVVAGPGMKKVPAPPAPAAAPQPSPPPPASSALPPAASEALPADRERIPPPPRPLQ
jgi:hypothetical protein